MKIVHQIKHDIIFCASPRMIDFRHSKSEKLSVHLFEDWTKLKTASETTPPRLGLSCELISVRLWNFKDGGS